MYRWPDCLPNDRCERHPPRSPVRSRGVATAPSYDFRSGRGPSESASARGRNEGDHCTHASQRGLSQTVTRMPEFLERQSAVDNRRLPPAPGTKQNTADLARVVIDAMAVAGCRGWNCDIAWQPPANCCHRHPRPGSPPSLSGFNGHCAPHDDYSRVKPGSPYLAARPFSYGASPCLPPSTGRMELTPDERLRVTAQSSARRSAAPIFRGWRME